MTDYVMITNDVHHGSYRRKPIDRPCIWAVWSLRVWSLWRKNGRAEPLVESRVLFGLPGVVEFGCPVTTCFGCG